jgi:hypothetical protein
MLVFNSSIDLYKTELMDSVEREAIMTAFCSSLQGSVLFFSSSVFLDRIINHFDINLGTLTYL